MEDPSTFLRTVVRLFPDGADTVIWFAPGPVAYGDAKVSTGLATAMAEWERWYDAGSLTVDYELRPLKNPDAFRAEGLRLAKWLATELGDSFEVEVDNPDENNLPLRLRGDGAGTNPDAVAAFRQMAEKHLAMEKLFSDEHRRGVRLGLDPPLRRFRRRSN